jgi:hypothetical protein
MPTLEDKRTHAAQLYLMAADAFARGDRLRAKLFVAKANQYADEATALAEAQTIAQQQQRTETETAGKLGVG